MRDLYGCDFCVFIEHDVIMFFCIGRDNDDDNDGSTADSSCWMCFSWSQISCKDNFEPNDLDFDRNYLDFNDSNNDPDDPDDDLDDPDDCHDPDDEMHCNHPDYEEVSQILILISMIPN